MLAGHTTLSTATMMVKSELYSNQGETCNGLYTSQTESGTGHNENSSQVQLNSTANTEELINHNPAKK